MTKTHFQKIIVTICSVFLSVLFIGLNTSIVLAGDPPAAPPVSNGTAGGLDDAKSNIHSMNVRKYLSIGSDNTSDQAKGVQDQSYLKSGNPIAALIVQIINFIALTVASVAFLAVVYGGFLMMSSAGNETQVSKGKEILTHAAVGLVITLSAYFIIAFVQNILFETI